MPQLSSSLGALIAAGAIPYGTLCSGLDAVSLAWEPLGMKPVFFSENAANPSRILAHHWPRVPNLGDLTKIDGTLYEGALAALWASFPCQAWSEAGQGKGLDDPRGQLTLTGLRVVDEVDPPIFCFENVPKLLNTKDNAFGQFLGKLAGESTALRPDPDADVSARDRWPHCGFVLGPRRWIAWRVLYGTDFGVPQSRARLVVVACTRRSGIDPRRIVLERIPEGLAAGERESGGPDVVPGIVGGPVPRACTIAIRGRLIKGVDAEQIEQGGPIANCLRTAGGGSSVPYLLVQENGLWRVRQHTETEAERLMGIPENHTAVKGLSRTARLTAVGNSLVVPMVRWIGEQIVKVLHEAA